MSMSIGGESCVETKGNIVQKPWWINLDIDVSREAWEIRGVGKTKQFCAGESLLDHYKNFSS